MPTHLDRLSFELRANALRLRRGVARMSMTYEGPSAEDAVTHFAAELAKVVPGSTCRGFRWPEPR